MIVNRFERQLNQAQNSSFGFVEDLRDSFDTVVRLAENENVESIPSQFEDFNTNISQYFDAPERHKTQDKNQLFDLASRIGIEDIVRDVRRPESPPVETKPVDSTPDMTDSQNTSMIPDLDLKSGGIILAAGVLALVLLRGDS